MALIPRRLGKDEREALLLLADAADGCTQSILMVHGFTQLGEVAGQVPLQDRLRRVVLRRPKSAATDLIAGRVRQRDRSECPGFVVDQPHFTIFAQRPGPLVCPTHKRRSA
jgi:hypothetical protein